MLSRRDKEWILKAIREEFKEALYREVTVSRAAKGPGDVDGKIEEIGSRSLLDLMVEFLPEVSKSLIGSEAASNQARNRSNEVLKQTDAMVGTLLSMKESTLVMARFALALKETGLLEQLEKALEIEYIDPKAIKDEANTG